MKDMDYSGLFAKTVRKRVKGQRRPGTKSKKIRSTMERTFQEEMARIRAFDPANLPSANTLPKPQLIKPRKKPGLIEKVKARLYAHGAKQDVPHDD